MDKSIKQMKEERVFGRAPLDERGRELCDPTPVAVPVSITRVGEVDRVRWLVREMMSQHAEREGSESFEEADDFDLEDDDDLGPSGFEIDFEPPAQSLSESVAPPAPAAPVSDPSVDGASPAGTDAPGGA